MATRLFCHTLMRQMQNAHKQMTPRGSYTWNELLRCGQTLSYRGTPRAALLHVKVYDKDTGGLDEQRKYNQHKKQHEEQERQSVTSDKHFTATHTERPNRKWTRDAETTTTTTKNQIIESREQREKVLPNEEDDADTFGNAKIHAAEDAGDLAEEEFISNRPTTASDTNTRRTKKLRTKEYAHLIKELMNAGRLKEAIEVLELRMLKEDRVKPENYIYNLLISGCAKAGYTRKAFSLFTRMRQRGLTVTGGTYTSLFNACANSPTAADGLGRIQHLREIMLEKGFEPNVKTYNVMIKAYGRFGDVKNAYELADMMMERQLAVNTETFNFLLQACASDAEFGFRHSLLTWHKMLQRGIQPDYYSFHTVLRCVRDCDFGDLETMQQVLQQILDERQTVQITSGESISKEAATEDETHMAEGKQLQQPPASTEKQLEIKSAALTLNESAPTALQLSSTATQLEVPNLLSARPHLGSLVSLAEVRKPHERFLLLGGLGGFLELMKQCSVTPDIECFTTMLEVVPPTNAAEKQLLSFIRKIGLKADIDFFNVLIKKRSMRFDYDGAKEVLSMIRTAGLHPDIVTYGVLALGCTTAEASGELLQQMRQNGIRMNIQILGAMLRQGCAQKAFAYVNEIMQISLDENIKPNDVFLRHLHNYHTLCARAIDARHPSTKTQSFKKAHSKFCDKLRLYYEEQGIAGLKLEDAIRKIKERPYTQYKEQTVDGLEPVKNEQLAKKQKLRKYIKKIKIDNLQGDNTDGDENTERSRNKTPRHKYIE